MIDEFLSDLHDFQNKAGYFNKIHIWIAASWMVCMPIFGIPGTPICSLNG
jgi:hypothetical protein